MEVKFTNEAGNCTAKILWRGSYPMRGGKFPHNHPILREAMSTFRDRGYWASCYPEGDGVTFYSLSEPKEDKEVIRDIEECLGFTVVARFCTLGSVNA